MDDRMITVFMMPADGQRLVMIVNESGLINGLPLNPIASIVYHDLLGAETPIVGMLYYAQLMKRESCRIYHPLQ